MAAVELLNKLTARGVKLRVVGTGKLVCEGDPGEFAGELRDNKEEVFSIIKQQRKKYSKEILNKIIQGDCLDVLKNLPENYIDQVVCDPPFGWGFMGKHWDEAIPGVPVWKEVLRVLKPGGLAFIMSGPRQDGLVQMIENLKTAGFNVHYTSLYWTYASGFTKAKNLAKAIDKQNGKKGKVIGIKKNKIDFSNSRRGDSSFYDAAWRDRNYTDLEITEPETDQAKSLEGAYAGFQPKPAVEVILVVMKPLAEKSYMKQAQANGKGCTWLDRCRIPYANESIPSRDLVKQKSSTVNQVLGSKGNEWQGHQVGRVPANLLVSDNALDNGKKHKGGGVGGRAKHGRGEGYGFKPLGNNVPEIPEDEGGYSRYFSLDAWSERNLPFLLVPKASKTEKNAGLGSLPEKTVSDGRNTPKDNAFQGDVTPRRNTHPCTKPVKLMAYLISMGSRPGDIVLDPFCGSGTTCLAAKLLDRKFIGIERVEAYYEIAKARVENTSTDVPVLRRAVKDIKKHETDREQHQEDDPIKAPEPSIFTNMPQKQLNRLLEAGQEDCQSL